MYVPNYIPEPLEVPGNITLRPYRMRVAFIRQVVWLHTFSLFVVAGLGFLPGRDFPGKYLGLALVVLLLLLDVLRIRLRGKALEAKLSSAFLVPIVILVAWCAADLYRQGWPIWAVLCGACAVSVYTIACGRDFSFVGCFAVSLVLSSLGIFGAVSALHLPSGTVSRALLINLVYLCYAVYDLASLLARRRENEQLAAVVDLYRDVFNFVGYFRRCLQHWKKHRIWVSS
jgi:putative effector of murein hydrolase LrgA (UPF0299 family)